MRIRKRFPPSSLSSVSLSSSDPQLTRSPPLMQHHQLQSASTDSQPSDPPNQPHHPHLSNQAVMIGSEKPRWVHEQKELDGEVVVKDERWSDEAKNNVIIRKSCNLGQDSSTQILAPSASQQVVERWVEGDKVIPLKKRIVRDETKTAEKDKKMKAKMKSKTNKKCIAPNSEEQEEGSERSKTKSSYNKRGSEVMEGSRCSRVNGRGWRCGQQTLVGYSLCEHHLGKGRLRSMTSVRSRAVANTRVAPHKPELEPEPEPKPEPEQLLDYDDDDYDDDDDEEDSEALMGSKKRMRHGVVKARSIRSLLGQTNDECYFM